MKIKKNNCIDLTIYFDSDSGYLVIMYISHLMAKISNLKFKSTKNSFVTL